MYYFFPTTSVSVPERLEFVVNKYAEHTHEKWSLDKVMSPHLFLKSERPVKVDKAELMYDILVRTEPLKNAFQRSFFCLTVSKHQSVLCGLANMLTSAYFLMCDFF